MDKQVRYVYTVNPITRQPCTIRIVVTETDVALWQIDQVDGHIVRSEKAFDQLDTEDMSMISMPHKEFSMVMGAYADAFDRLMPDNPRAGRTKA